MTRANGAYGRIPGLRTLVDVKIPMRDGVALSADIYLPAGEGPFPAVLVRTPYDNARLMERGVGFAENGYAYVGQDCRGRYDSEGSFYPWHQEVADGPDTRKWIAAQPWCNGRIGTVGGSYLGMAQWLGMIEGTENLSAIMPSVSPIDGWIWGNQYVNGAYQLALNLGWGLSTAGRTNQPLLQYNWKKLLGHLPLDQADVAATGRENPFIQDWIRHATYDEYWRRISTEERFAQIDVPVFQIAGWFDAYPAAALRAFVGIRRNAKSEAIRRAQKILIGPWPHQISVSRTTGQVDFGEHSLIDTPERLAGHNVPLDLTLRWFDRWLKGVENGIEHEAPVRIFVMGANIWRDEQEWPLARTRFTPYYFRSGGRLGPQSPEGREPPDEYLYDPNDPVWEAGGNFSYTVPGLGGPLELSGPFDQRAIESRRDVLVYTSEVLAGDLEVTGPVVAEIFISSSAPDTDFALRLVDVHPDGKALGYTEGIVRARYRDSFEFPQLMEPGRIYRLRIELQPTSLVFKAGHRIRLHITSSDYPHFDRNPNTGGEFGRETEWRTAAQKVYHEATYPSHILLPVIPS